MRNANGRQENALDDVLGGRLQAMLMESHRRREERVAELRALGREPASREDEVRAINATVDFTLRRSGPDLVEVRLGFRRGAERVLAWGADWPDAGATASRPGLLAALAAAWPAIAAPFRGLPPRRAAIAPPGLPALAIEPDGERPRLVAPNGTWAPGTEWVLGAQVLMAIGDILRAWSPGGDPAAEAWTAAGAAGDLPPIDVSGDGPGALYPQGVRADWFAARLGVDRIGYRLAAYRVHARQVLHAFAGEPEPSPGEWEPGNVPAGLDRAEIDDLLRRASEAVERVDPRDPDGIRDDALKVREYDAFQAIFYPSQKGLG